MPHSSKIRPSEEAQRKIDAQRTLDNLKPETAIFVGEQPTQQPPKKRRTKTAHIRDLELPIDLYEFLKVDAEENERTIQASTRWWLKRATGIK